MAKVRRELTNFLQIVFWALMFGGGLVLSYTSCGKSAAFSRSNTGSQSTFCFPVLTRLTTASLVRFAPDRIDSSPSALQPHGLAPFPASGGAAPATISPQDRGDPRKF